MIKKWFRIFGGIIFIFLGIIFMIFFYDVEIPGYQWLKWAVFGTALLWICFGVYLIYFTIKKTEVPR